MFYLLAHMIDKPEVGSTMDALPLHMTVVHWFEYGKGAEELIDCCESALALTSAFVVRVGVDDMFGPNKDVPVSRIEPSAELSALHRGLLQALGQLGVEHSASQWTGDGFNAHVTDKKDKRLHAGDEFRVDSVSLFSAEDIQSPRTLIEQFELAE